MSDAPSSERVPTVDEVRMRIVRMIGKRRDHIAERELAKMLRAIPESDAFDLIWQYIEREAGMGLTYANRVLRDRNHHERILERGFELANVSSIQGWLSVGIARLGPRRVMTMFEELAQREPRRAAGFLYYARPMLREADRTLQDRLALLVRELYDLVPRQL